MGFWKKLPAAVVPSLVSESFYTSDLATPKLKYVKRRVQKSSSDNNTNMGEKIKRGKNSKKEVPDVIAMKVRNAPSTLASSLTADQYLYKYRLKVFIYLNICLQYMNVYIFFDLVVG
jgi:hypothetical protein